MHWTQNFKGILNLFLQANCPLCQRSTQKEFCQDCTRQLQSTQRQNPVLWQGELPVFVWGVYGGTLKRAIAALKYENQPQIAQPLGIWLAQAWLNSKFAESGGGFREGVSPSHPQLFKRADSSPIVVPIPLHTDKLQKRGYNQATLLAQSFCQITGLKLQQHGLERVRDTKAQFGLSATQRGKNLTNAFELGTAFRRQRPTKPILILDDIYTTGATVNCAAQTLCDAGMRVYGVVAIASSSRE